VFGSAPGVQCASKTIGLEDQSERCVDTSASRCSLDIVFCIEIDGEMADPSDDMREKIDGVVVGEGVT